MSSHAMMGDFARFHLPPEHPLADLLEAHRPALIAGAMFPDGGYFTGLAIAEHRDLAETAHWDTYVNHLTAIAHERGCAQLGDDPWDSLPVLGGTVDWLMNELGRELVPLPSLRAYDIDPPALQISDSCGYLVAFTMGVAAHGMGDEVWDALFEPTVYQRGEMEGTGPHTILDTIPPGADPSVGEMLRSVLGDTAFDALESGFSAINGVEYAMDVIAIRDQWIWEEIPLLVFPPTQTLLEAYRRSGREFSQFDVEMAAAGTRLLVTAERLASAADYTRVRQQMPYAVSNYLTGSGGIHDAAKYIAGYYEHLWSRIQDGPNEAMPPFVTAVHPRPGERNVPWKVCDTGDNPFAVCQDAAAPEADRYIYVGLSASMGSRFEELDTPFAVFDESGQELEVEYQQLPPWASPLSAHGFRIKLKNQELKPKHRYTVVVTTQLYDRRGPETGRMEQPMIWHFTTAD
nr:hypothetical protein [Oceanococcus sp. HetDA_MAG_MS8]